MRPLAILAAALTSAIAVIVVWLNTRDLYDDDSPMWAAFKQRLESEEFSEDITFAGGTWTS